MDKKQESKTRQIEGAVEVKVDLLTGAMRVDPHKLLRSEATRKLLTEAACVEKLVAKGRSG